jgi:hypothetical protein
MLFGFLRECILQDVRPEAVSYDTEGEEREELGAREGKKGVKLGTKITG